MRGCLVESSKAAACASFSTKRACSWICFFRRSKPVDFRRNSLAVQGMIRCVEKTAAAAETRTPPAIRALIVTLLPVLSSVPCDGRLVKLSDRCYDARIQHLLCQHNAVSIA